MDDRTNWGYSQAQVMMTLSAIAYSSLDSIFTLQDKLNETESLGHSFEALWWAKNKSIQVYAVKNRLTEEYIIAINGPVFKIGLPFLFDLYESLNISRQLSMPFSRLGNARIAAGVLDIMMDISELSHGGLSLNRLINELPARARLFVTGHGLGGSLACTLAARSACSNLSGLDIIPFTFGAPCTGNKSFSDLFDDTHVNHLFSQSFRYINDLDMMPFVWTDLRGTTTIDYGDINCSIEYTLSVECIERMMIIARVFYVQPSPHVQLDGKLVFMSSFFQEAMHQHHYNTYLSLLGLDPMIDGGFITSEREQTILIDSL